MVTFYLYDDTPARKNYREWLDRAVEKFQIEAKIVTFTYRNAMLKHIKKNPHQADLIYITADGRNFNCLEVIKAAKELGNQAVFVIYGKGFNGAKSMENEGYCLKSPFTEEDFERVFLEAWKEYEGKRQTSLNVMIGKMTKMLPIGEIRYLSVENRVVYAHIRDEVYRFYASLMELEEELKQEGFVRVHRGYMVNGKYMREYRLGHVILEDETKLPVGRYYRDEVKKVMEGCR